jgi:hypothetical protein
MALVQFQNLWTNHPYPEFPCDKDTFKNQCAIRMGVALEKSGVDTKSFDLMYPKRRCYPGFKHEPRHILAAQELANWIWRRKSQRVTFGDVEIHKKVSSERFSKRKGIVFIKNGWGATDHIDLWNGSALKGGAQSYFSLGEEVWFWELTA